MRLALAMTVAVVVSLSGPQVARASTAPLDRAQLAALLTSEIGAAQSDIHAAATDCTLALFSEPLRWKASERPLKGRVMVVLEQRGRCAIPAYEPAPPPYALTVRRLVPMRVDAAGMMIHRREFVLIDRKRLIVILSDAASATPNTFYVHSATVEADPAARELVGQLGAVLWPEAYRNRPPGEPRSDPRWSLDNHRTLTGKVLGALGFAPSAVAVVEAGNLNVDRLANQFNNPQHSMRNLFQTVEEARAEAVAWIVSRKSAVVARATQGDACCALFALGEALHTIQDRKHGFIPLYRHLIHETLSDYRHHHAPEEWETAQRESREFCDEVLAALLVVGSEAGVRALKSGSAAGCTCDGFTVKAAR